MDMVRYFFINRFPIRNTKMRLSPRWVMQKIL
jgi:hypothetical protein